jgi:glycerol uptake facilitator protein
MFKQCFAEIVGTFILVFFGCGVVAVDVISGAHVGLFQVAIVWGLAVNLAIYLVGSISGAHLNPAITVSMAIYRPKEFPAQKIVPFITAQLVGAMLAATLLYGMFSGTLIKFEAAHNLVRGAAGSELSAMMFGEYFPNPAIYGTTSEAFAQVSKVVAFMAELLGTALLALGIFALTDRKKFDGPKTGFRIFTYFIGFVLAICIIIFAPFSQAGFNPARDFGPRLVSYIAGWGKIAIPGPQGGFFLVYILAPIVGAVVGGGVYKIITKVSPVKEVEAAA